jgi:hypothetical protein
MKTPKDPETTEIYLENFKQFGSALMECGGEPFKILKNHDEFLRTLALNNISVTAKYDGPEFKKEPTHYVDPKALVTKLKKQEDYAKEEYGAVSYEQHEAEAIEEECRTAEKDYNEIDWTTCKKENSEDYLLVKRRLSKNDVATSVVRLSDYKVFIKNDYNQKFYHIDKESFLNEHYTFNEVQKFVDQGLFVVLNQINDPMWQKPLSTSNPMPNTTSP